ncbi:hypothetical protein Syun_017720 [Stephania yunnanensis]|uniref:Uncharacterized protein n=1 Tax=Stephania yunnanensis TaxID=152371 RepID=A0AAP0J7K2_9MAGN
MASSGIAGVAQKCPSSRNDWLIKIKESHEAYTNEQSQTQPNIRKVPSRFREVKAYKKCFDPAMASIGPYHHGKPEFEYMERLKAPFTHQFVSGSVYDITIFYSRILEVVPQARKSYADVSAEEFDDEAFARLMLLDGCFVLQFIDCIEHNKENELTTNSYNVAFLVRDMFLLENQLPYLVLKVLMDLRFPCDGGKAMIDNFINQQFSPLGQLKQREPGPMKQSSTADAEQPPLHLLDLLRTKMLEGHFVPFSPKSQAFDWHSFRSVKELRSVGIDFKKSCSNSLKDIKFKSYKVYGELSLPPIAIDDSSKPKFLNLMVYELFLDASQVYSVTSYICFLDSLIDTADDVKELRSKGILLNSLGSDDQVADLFNQVADEMVPHPRAYYYVKQGIESHYKNKKKVSMVEFLTTHFSSPWTAFAFFAATFVIILTCIQTVYTVYSSYHK